MTRIDEGEKDACSICYYSKWCDGKECHGKMICIKGDD